MSEELEPWDAEVSALLDDARREVEPSNGAQARLADRLALSIAGEADRARPSRRPRGPTAVLLALAASFALGVGFHAILRRSPRGTVAVRPSIPTSPVPPSIPSGRHLGTFGALDSSGRALLDEAAARLMRGDAAGALAQLDEHARLYPTGALTELREALYVEALARAGRSADARARAARFFDAYPTSLLGPAVSDALGRIPDE